MNIDLRDYIDSIQAEIDSTVAEMEHLRDEIKKVDPLRKKIMELEERKFHLEGAMSNLLILRNLDPEVQAVLNPVDPFGDAAS